jgi:hypothetical protein
MSDEPFFFVTPPRMLPPLRIGQGAISPSGIAEAITADSVHTLLENGLGDIILDFLAAGRLKDIEITFLPLPPIDPFDPQVAADESQATWAAICLLASLGGGQ